MSDALVRTVDAATGEVVVAVAREGGVHPVPDVSSMGDLLGRPLSEIRRLVESSLGAKPITPGEAALPPIDGATEVWAAGVTYERSRQARVEESAVVDVYDKVYSAQRPELFFKCPAWRAVTDGEPIGRRHDSTNDTPEPEVGLLLNFLGEVVGYLAVNDMSSRSIEGENPLYLPQAKIYDGSCSLSPTITPAWLVTKPGELTIRLRIERDGQEIFAGSATTAQLKRSFDELVAYLFRAQAFPAGVVLSTGTCLVPPLDTPTLDGDVVRVDVDGVGSITNQVTSAPGLGEWLWQRSLDPLIPPPEPEGLRRTRG